MSAGCGNSLSDAAQRALGADEQRFDVVARVVLAQALERRHHAAIGQHHLQPEHQVAHHSIAQHGRAPGIRRQVAADLRGAFRSQAQGEQPVGAAGGGLGLGQSRAGLHDHRVVAGVEPSDAIQPPHGQHDLRGAFIRRRRSAVARIAAVRNHGDLVAVADGEHLGHFTGVSRQEHQRRRPVKQPPKVHHVGCRVGGGLEPGAVADGGLEFVEGALARWAGHARPRSGAGCGAVWSTAFPPPMAAPRFRRHDAR